VSSSGETSSESCRKKFLGLKWNTVVDHFVVVFPSKAVKEFTKRTVLSQLTSVFDPLGLASPALLEAKLFVSRLWDLELGWDDPIPDFTACEWIKVIHS
jgi:hypothetical protein